MNNATHKSSDGTLYRRTGNWWYVWRSGDWWVISGDPVQKVVEL